LWEAVLWKLHIVYTTAWAETPQTVQVAVACKTASVAGCMQGCKMASVVWLGQLLVGGCKRAFVVQLEGGCKRAFVVQLEGGCKRALQELLLEHCMWAFGVELEGGIMCGAGCY